MFRISLQEFPGKYQITFFSFLFFSLIIFYTTASGVPLTDLGSKTIMVNMVHSVFSLTR